MQTSDYNYSMRWVVSLAACHDVEAVEPYMEDCLYDMCSCTENLKDCVCPTLGTYADTCAAKDVKLNWRPQIPDCSKFSVNSLSKSQWPLYEHVSLSPCRILFTVFIFVLQRHIYFTLLYLMPYFHHNAIFRSLCHIYFTLPYLTWTLYRPTWTRISVLTTYICWCIRFIHNHTSVNIASLNDGRGFEKDYLYQL